LALATSWGNTAQDGVAQLYDPGNGDVAFPNSYATGVDADLAGHVAFSGYTIADDSSTPALIGSLDAHGDLDPAWINGGVVGDANGIDFRANAVLIDSAPGTFPLKGYTFAGEYAPAPCVPGNVCGSRGGPFYTGLMRFGVLQSF